MTAIAPEAIDNRWQRAKLGTRFAFGTVTMGDRGLGTEAALGLNIRGLWALVGR